ncbi:MAG: sigma-70 family RNA polymerase sigma factor [Bryobacteraceae bacterium]|jgi:RNA polymerase sigma-70 factor (ECF subfamily)
MNFDSEFLTRLKQRDPDTCTFLVSSLSPVLEARLRYKLRDHGAIEDIRNETFYRVFCLVDGGRVREPEHFGWLVRGVCDRVAQESRRKAGAAEPLPGDGMEPPDRQPHLDKILVENERRAQLWREVMRLSEADRRLIVEMYYEERDRWEMARERGISKTVLNVRLCRALARLRERVLQRAPAVKPACRPRARGAHTRAGHVPAHGDACSPNRWATMAA